MNKTREISPKLVNLSFEGRWALLIVALISCDFDYDGFCWKSLCMTLPLTINFKNIYNACFVHLYKKWIAMFPRYSPSVITEFVL